MLILASMCLIARRPFGMPIEGMGRPFVWQDEELFQAICRGVLPACLPPFGDIRLPFVGQSEELFQPFDFGDDLFGLHVVAHFFTASMLELDELEV